MLFLFSPLTTLPGTVAAALLVAHLTLLALFAYFRWAPRMRRAGVTPATTVTTLLEANFIGVACARTLHYQFLAWYWHSLPLLLFGVTALPAAVSIVLCACVEDAFNAYPSTPGSSLLLQGAHAVILAALFVGETRKPSAKKNA